MEAWSDEMFKTAVGMERWSHFVRAVDAERKKRWVSLRDAEAVRLAATMDMTPEGYVREWNRRGRKNILPLEAWEHAYQEAGLVEQAERLGYIRIGRGADCEVTIETRGESLL